MTPYDWIAVIALGFGAAIGLGSFISPSWAAGVVRLQSDGRPGGYSEFRATYGGLLLLLHLSALVILVRNPGVTGALVAWPIALGWLGAALGRLLSLVTDTDKLNGAGLIPVWIATEIALAIAIGLPTLMLLV